MRLTANALDLYEHRGPQMLHWRRRMAASVGAVLLDDLPAVVETER